MKTVSYFIALVCVGAFIGTYTLLTDETQVETKTQVEMKAAPCGGGLCPPDCLPC